jgi:hypothetical protein
VVTRRPRTPFLRLLHGGRNTTDDEAVRPKADDERCALIVLYPSRRTIQVAPAKPPTDPPGPGGEAA